MIHAERRANVGSGELSSGVIYRSVSALAPWRYRECQLSAFIGGQSSSPASRLASRACDVESKLERENTPQEAVKSIVAMDDVRQRADVNFPDE